MQRIKSVVAVLLALIWLPAASCCLVDASGWFGKQDCCSKEHSQPASVPGNCNQPCGVLASASYVPQQDQLIVPVPMCVPLFDAAFPLTEIHRPAGVGRELPATAPPELAGHWQFYFRTALAPRAPSLAS